MLRRFDQFQWGPLNAVRLNELVDAITRLQQQVAQFTPTRERGKDMILARIKGEGRQLRTQECENSVRMVSYPFDEIGISISTGSDTIGENSCASYSAIEGGVTSDGGSLLMSREDEPALNDGDVVMANYAPGIVSYLDGRRRAVYLITQAARPVMGLYLVLGSLGSGRYSVVDATFPGLGPEEMENIYETSTWYGAKDPPQNPCAQLQERSLRVGDEVFGFKVGGSLYTCAPTAFTVECLPCGTAPQGISALYDSAGAEAAAASKMLGG